MHVAVVRLDSDRCAEVLLTTRLPAQVAWPGGCLRQFEVTQLVLMRIQSVDRREQLRAGVTAAVGVLGQIYIRFRYNDAIFRR